VKFTHCVIYFLVFIVFLAIAFQPDAPRINTYDYSNEADCHEYESLLHIVDMRIHLQVQNPQTFELTTKLMAIKCCNEIYD
jgi:hypothetical protein